MPVKDTIGSSADGGLASLVQPHRPVSMEICDVDASNPATGYEVVSGHTDIVLYKTYTDHTDTTHPNYIGTCPFGMNTTL